MPYLRPGGLTRQATDGGCPTSAPATESRGLIKTKPAESGFVLGLVEGLSIVGARRQSDERLMGLGNPFPLSGSWTSRARSSRGWSATTGRRGHPARGDYAYILVHPARLVVLDLSAPASPRPLAEPPAVGGAMDLVLVGQQAFVIGCAGLALFDLADPALAAGRPDPAAGGSAVRRGRRPKTIGSTFWQAAPWWWSTARTRPRRVPTVGRP